MSEVKIISHTESVKYGDKYLGQVVRILDEYSIVVSTSRYVKDGDIVQVFDIGEELFGLDGKSLGYYIYIKATLKVTQIESKYCICQALTEEKVKPTLLTPFTAMTQTISSQLSLPIKHEDIQEIPSIDMIVHIGDKVRKRH